MGWNGMGPTHSQALFRCSVGHMERDRVVPAERIFAQIRNRARPGKRPDDAEPLTPRTLEALSSLAPRVVVRVMNKGSIHKRETHGTSDDISEDTPVEKVRGPNLFERAKEEIEALVATVHDKMEHHSSPRRKEGELHKDSKEHSEADMHKKTHENETHGTSNDISEDTPVNKVKGPNVFERAKEEIEAIVEAIHPKKESDKK